MTEGEQYRRDGYVALARLFPPELLGTFYQKMQADLKAAGRPLQSFKAQGPAAPRRSDRGLCLSVSADAYLLVGLTSRMAQVAGCELMAT